MTASAGWASEGYRALFENSLDAVFFTAPDGQVFAANPAACAMFGYTEQELCALGREGVFDPADRERAAAAVATRAAAGQIQTVLSYRRRDGTTFPGEVSSRIFTDASGEPRTCIVLRDITEREQMRERLADQLRQTQTASDELAAFTNYVVHDLRVPLRAMNGYSLTLAEDYGDRLDDTAQDLIDRIREASRNNGRPPARPPPLVPPGPGGTAPRPGRSQRHGPGVRRGNSRPTTRAVTSRSASQTASRAQPTRI